MMTEPDPNKAVGEPEDKWYSGLPEEYHEVVSRFKSTDDLAKGYVNLDKSASMKVKVPGDDASDEDWGKFYGKIGRPDSADGYEGTFENANEDFVKTLKSLSHGANLSKKQFEKMSKGLYEYESGVVTQRKQDAEVKRNEMLEGLSKEVGGDEPLKQVISNAVAAVEEIEEKHGLKGLKEYFDESGHGDNPLMIKLFDFIGKNILSDSLVKGNPPKGAKKTQRWEKEFHERYDNKAS
jgi:hypothetical protein